jgi:hypothetical protein
MNNPQAIRTAGRVGGFFTRHFLALAVTVASVLVIWTIVYIALLLWAMFTDGGIGGPLAYPAGLVFFFVATTVVGLALLAPSTALAEWFARRRRWPILAQIPLSVAVLALLCLVVVSMASAIGSTPTLHGVSVGFGVLFLALLLPLGVYWWVAQSVPILFSVIRWLRGFFRL